MDQIFQTGLFPIVTINLLSLERMRDLDLWIIMKREINTFKSFSCEISLCLQKRLWETMEKEGESD